jgi:hypothetical protein
MIDVMQIKARRLVLGLVGASVCGAALLHAQQGGGLTAAEKQRRWDMERELERIAVIDRKVMMPMPDGVRLASFGR